MKKILLLLLLTVSILFGGAKFKDLRLLHYPQARPWLEDADTNGISAYNIGVLYQQTIKDDEKAIVWYKRAYEMDDEDAAGTAANNLGYLYDHNNQNKKAEEWYKKGISKNSSDSSLGLGLLYKKLHRYDDAIFYYKKAYKMGNIGAATSLGYLYDVKLHNAQKAMKWYKIGAKGGDTDSIKNLALSYRDQGKKIEGAALYIALINQRYSREKVLNYLKTKWKLTDEDIKKAYFLQKTLDIPKHYYDAEFEGKPQTKRRGRR